MAKQKQADEAASSTSLLSLGLPIDPLTLDFTEVIQVFAGGNRSAPPWLVDCFEEFAPALFVDRLVMARAPLRADLKKKLDEVRGAVGVLLNVLLDDDLWPLVKASELDEAVPCERFRRQLKLVADQAETGTASLLGANGKVKAGRGRAFSDQTFSPEAHCAVLIAECWRSVQGRYPAPRNENAHRAADLLWLAVGGVRRENVVDELET